MALEGGQNLCVRPFRRHFLANSWRVFATFWWILGLFGGFYVLWGSTFWDFWRILRPVGEHFLGLLEDFTSCEEALFGVFGGFYVLWGSTFWAFWRILRPVGKHFLGFSEDFTCCGGALFWAFGAFWLKLMDLRMCWSSWGVVASHRQMRNKASRPIKFWRLAFGKSNYLRRKNIQLCALCSRQNTTEISIKHLNRSFSKFK